MILFLDDWKKFPTAIPDFQTTNTSFLVLVETYRKMGIENCLFPLALYQPALQGVDPFSPDLTLEQKVMITHECKFNPWYFLREVARVPVSGYDVPSRFLAHRGNIALFWCFLNHFDYANIMPRQTGKSVGADCLNNWMMHISGYNTIIQLFTHSRTLRAANIERLKKIRGTLPKWLNFYQDGVDRDNTEMLTCKRLANEYLTAVAQKDPEQATLLGRGLTSPIVQSDEGPFCSNIEVTFPAMMGSTSAARDAAMKNGTFYGNVMTTTAGDTLTKEGKFVHDMIVAGMPWSERLFDARYWEDAADMIRKNSKGYDITKGSSGGVRVLMINGTFSAMQVGKSREWLATKIAQARGSDDDIRRDYLNEWTSGSEASPLPPEIQETIRGAICDVEYQEMSKDNYLTNWYIPASAIEQRMASTWCLLTLDTANISGSDANALLIQDAKNMEVLGTSEVKEGNLHKYAVWIADLLVRYPQTILVIENKSSAQGILDYVATRLITLGIDPFKRVYNQIIDQPERYATQYRALCNNEHHLNEHFYERNKKLFGFMTTGASRELLYNTIMQRACRQSGHLIRDRSLSEQLRLLVNKNGRIDHPSGGNDDMCVSWLLGHFFASMGRNHAWYGLPYGLVHSHVTESGALLSKDQKEKLARHEILMEQINTLKTKMSSEKVDIRKQAIEMRINSLIRQLDDDDKKTQIRDEVFKEMAEKKKKANNLSDAIRRRRSRGFQ